MCAFPFCSFRRSFFTACSHTHRTPWLPTESGPKLVVDEALGFCTTLTHLTVAGWDVSDSLFSSLPSTSQLVHLGVTDFEAITPAGLLSALHRRPCMKKLQTLAVWQRNGGLSAAGTRIATGWFTALFERHRGPLADALAVRGVKVGTGWESRLLSGGELGALRSHRCTFEADRSRRLLALLWRAFDETCRSVRAHTTG